MKSDMIPRGGWRVEGGEWRVESGEWRVEGKGFLDLPPSTHHPPPSTLHPPRLLSIAIPIAGPLEEAAFFVGQRGQAVALHFFEQFVETPLLGLAGFLL